jgi:hypothetical protein
VPIRFGRVDVLAAGTVELDGFLVGYIRETDGKQGLRVTVYAGTAAEICFAVFVELELSDVWAGRATSRRLTILPSPRLVMIYRACMRP